MKFSTFILNEESSVELAKSERELLKSVKNGRFTKSGRELEIDGNFHCDHMRLTTLAGAPRVVRGNFSATGNMIKSLSSLSDDVEEIDGVLDLSKNPIKEGVLSVLRIKNLKRVELDNEEVKNILNAYLKKPFGNARILECQSAMLDAGLDEYAQL